LLLIKYFGLKTNSTLIEEMGLRTSLFGLAAAAALVTVTYSSISDCSNGNSLFQLTDLALTPDPPVRNEPLHMTVVFNNPGEDVSSGTVTTSVTLNWIPFSPTVEALCDNTQCPLINGLNDRSTSSIWPDTVSGNVQSKIEWTGVDGSQLLCIKISAKVAAAENITGKLRGWPVFSQEHAVNISKTLRLDTVIPYDDLYELNSWSPFDSEELLDMCFPEDQMYEEFMTSLMNPPLAIKWTNMSLL
jgi:hypothetical protein